MAEVSIKDIRTISKNILTASGVPKEHADIVSDTIVYAHQVGKGTHGLGRLEMYERKIREGLMSADAEPKIVTEGPAYALYDAGDGFGQVASYKAMKHAISLAESEGIAMAGVRNSNSFAVAGYYGEMAAAEGMAGIVMGNAAPALAPPGGKKAVMGTNPICFAFPGTGDRAPVILDMATSLVARSKIRAAQRSGEKIPSDWALDKDGKPTDDPAAAIEGSLLPMGGYKGFGLAIAVDILAGMITGSAFGGSARNLNHPSEKSKVGHFMIAVNIDAFMDRQEYEAKLEELIESVKACGEEGAVMMPGERAYNNYLSNLETVDVKENIIDGVNKLAAKLGIEERV
jgi:L-2-hydroxycarboxylate dehydrogenase (NAD+)